MAKIKIKKRISLEFLGEEYKEAFLVLTGITLREYEQNIAKTKDMGNEDATSYIKKILLNHFVEGKFPDDKGQLQALEANDLLDLDISTIFKVFNQLSGVETPPNLGTP